MPDYRWLDVYLYVMRTASAPLFSLAISISWEYLRDKISSIHQRGEGCNAMVQNIDENKYQKSFSGYSPASMSARIWATTEGRSSA